MTKHVMLAATVLFAAAALNAGTPPAQTAKAELKDAKGQVVGMAKLTQTKGGGWKTRSSVPSGNGCTTRTGNHREGITRQGG